MKTKDKAPRKFSPFILSKDRGIAPTRSSLKVSLIPATPTNVTPLKDCPDESSSTTPSFFTFDVDAIDRPPTPCAKCRHKNGFVLQVNSLSSSRKDSETSIQPWSLETIETGDRNSGNSCKCDSNFAANSPVAKRPMTSWPPNKRSPMRCRSASDVIPIRGVAAIKPRLLGVPIQLASSSSDSHLSQARKFWKNSRFHRPSIFGSKARLWPLSASDSGMKSAELTALRSSSAKCLNESSICLDSCSPQPSLRCWSAGSSSITDRRYSPLPLLNFDLPFTRSQRLDSVISVGKQDPLLTVDAVSEHVSFTRSLAFPVEPEAVLGGRRMKPRPDPHVETQMNLNRFAKIITAIILIFVAAMVIGVLYKLLES